jgi:hypothetical protein
VTYSVRIGSDPDQEVVQEEEATADGIPASWTRAKLEPSPANRKRPGMCLAESGHQIMAARTMQRDDATGSCCSSVEKDAGRDEEVSKLCLVSCSVRKGPRPDKEVAHARSQILVTRTKGPRSRQEEANWGRNQRSRLQNLVVVVGPVSRNPKATCCLDPTKHRQ